MPTFGTLYIKCKLLNAPSHGSHLYNKLAWEVKPTITAAGTTHLAGNEQALLSVWKCFLNGLPCLFPEIKCDVINSEIIRNDFLKTSQHSYQFSYAIYLLAVGKTVYTTIKTYLIIMTMALLLLNTVAISVKEECCLRMLHVPSTSYTVKKIWLRTAPACMNVHGPPTPHIV